MSSHKKNAIYTHLTLSRTRSRNDTQMNMRIHILPVNAPMPASHLVKTWSSYAICPPSLALIHHANTPITLILPTAQEKTKQCAGITMGSTCAGRGTVAWQLVAEVWSARMENAWLSFLHTHGNMLQNFSWFYTWMQKPYNVPAHCPAKNPCLIISFPILQLSLVRYIQNYNAVPCISIQNPTQTGNKIWCNQLP